MHRCEPDIRVSEYQIRAVFQDLEEGESEISFMKKKTKLPAA